MGKYLLKLLILLKFPFDMHLIPLGINKAQWLIKSRVLNSFVKEFKLKKNFILRKSVLITQTAVYMLS